MAEVLHLDGEVLAGAYRNLANAKEGFDHARDVAEDVRAAIGQPGDMAAKVTGFADSWSVNRERLSKSVGKLAEKLKGIMDSFEDLDDQFGQAFADATASTSNGGSGTAGRAGTSGSPAAGSGTSAGAGSSTARSSGSAASGADGGQAPVSGTGGGADPAPSAPAIGGVNNSVQAMNGVPGTASSPVVASTGSGAPVIGASAGTASGGGAAMGGAAVGAGSAAAVGSLYRAWSGQARGTTPAPVTAQSRATIAQEFRGMSTTPGGSSATSSMSRGDVASLMKKSGSGYVPMGVGQSGGQAGKSDRERRSRVSPPPPSDADRLNDAASERTVAEPQDERDRAPRSDEEAK